MILDALSFKILKLAGLYRYLPYRGFDTRGLSEFAHETETLRRMKLLSAARSGEYFSLSQKGYALLKDCGLPFAPPSKRAYGGGRFLIRRLEAASIMLACLRAEMNVLPQDVYALAKPPVFLPAFLLRGAGNANGANLMNAAACAGFGRFGDGTYMFLYAEAESGGMYLVNELSHLHNLTAVTGTNARPAMIFAGKTYGGVYARVLKSLVPKNKNVKGFVDFHEAYKKAEIPIHLLSADETGALQLAVMARPDCKAKIARAAFGERHTPFDPEIPEADGAVCGLPLIVGIDMDIRRAKKVWEKAAALGRKEVLLAALPAQIKSFYLSVLPRGGIVTPLAAPDELLSSAFGKGFSLWEPELLPAKDAKGEFIRV